MTTCTITFSAVDTVGAQVMTPDTQRVVSDASGAGSIALVPGTYRLSMETSGGSRQVDITVPSSPTALLGDLIDTPLGEYEFSALQQLRADMVDAAEQVAVDRAALVLAAANLTTLINNPNLWFAVVGSVAEIPTPPAPNTIYLVTM
jgi:hypothetical protein